MNFDSHTINRQPAVEAHIVASRKTCDESTRTSSDKLMAFRKRKILTNFENRDLNPYKDEEGSLSKGEDYRKLLEAAKTGGGIYVTHDDDDQLTESSNIFKLDLNTIARAVNELSLAQRVGIADSYFALEVDKASCRCEGKRNDRDTASPQKTVNDLQSDLKELLELSSGTSNTGKVSAEQLPPLDEETEDLEDWLDSVL